MTDPIDESLGGEESWGGLEPAPVESVPPIEEVKTEANDSGWGRFRSLSSAIIGAVRGFRTRGIKEENTPLRSSALLPNHVSDHRSPTWEREGSWGGHRSTLTPAPGLGVAGPSNMMTPTPKAEPGLLHLNPAEAVGTPRHVDSLLPNPDTPAKIHHAKKEEVDSKTAETSQGFDGRREDQNQRRGDGVVR
ncbi:hypothetical protein FRB93_003105 [Tulasnella sp. JGI-2019a]|nr:hypothetical protein FRB93_003105 [Tulasnella sp. JGI-2019a]